MPETRKQAVRRARRLKFPVSNVVKGNGYFIAPRGIRRKSAKTAYAKCRARTLGKKYCSRIAHSVQKKRKRR